MDKFFQFAFISGIVISIVIYQFINWTFTADNNANTNVTILKPILDRGKHVSGDIKPKGMCVFDYMRMLLYF